MNHEKLVSVIVPIYRVEKYIKKCVDSILNQSYENLQVVLVDDGSPDNCGEICDRYANKDSRVIVIHKNNGGLSDARNRGLNIARGDYVLFVDSDDYLHRNCVLTLLEKAIFYNADIVQGMHTSDEKLLGVSLDNNDLVLHSGDDAFRYLMRKRQLMDMAWGKLYRTSLFDGIRYPFGKINEDSLTTYKLCLRARKVTCVHEYIYYYRTNGNSITHMKMDSKHFEAHRIPALIYEYLGDRGECFKSDINYYQMRRDVYLYNNIFNSGQAREFPEIINQLRDSIAVCLQDSSDWDSKYKTISRLIVRYPFFYRLVLSFRKNSI